MRKYCRREKKEEIYIKIQKEVKEFAQVVAPKQSSNRLSQGSYYIYSATKCALPPLSETVKSAKKNITVMSGETSGPFSTMSI